MDQDAFRQLLAGSRQPQPNTRLSTANIRPQKATTSTSSEQAFKPRNVKKTEGKYRDRAAERREGTVNDYAEVEAVLEDFEKRAAHEDRDVIEQQRQYLGGDSQHTILVKGLDMSLLEQNRARATTSTEDDEILEQVFAEATSKSESTVPEKRTREEIIRNLKAKQQDGSKPADQPVVEKSAEDVLETAKKAGKFRPIGFKPIGQTEGKPKKRKVKDAKEGMKKKQKVGSADQLRTNDRLAERTPAVSQRLETAEPSPFETPKRLPEPEPTPPDEDFDIFAGAGDYLGFQDDDEPDDGDGDAGETRVETQEAASIISVTGTKGWFGETETEVGQPSTQSEKSPPTPEATATEEEPRDARLKPLESSALPSIRDFLAMDEAAEKAEKRKARKEKKKKKKGAGDDDD